MSGLMPERYYRLVFKVTSGIYDEFIEDDFYFKIVSWPFEKIFPLIVLNNNINFYHQDSFDKL